MTEAQRHHDRVGGIERSDARRLVVFVGAMTPSGFTAEDHRAFESMPLRKNLRELRQRFPPSDTPHRRSGRRCACRCRARLAFVFHPVFRVNSSERQCESNNSESFHNWFWVPVSLSGGEMNCKAGLVSREGHEGAKARRNCCPAFL